MPSSPLTSNPTQLNPSTSLACSQQPAADPFSSLLYSCKMRRCTAAGPCVPNKMGLPACLLHTTHVVTCVNLHKGCNTGGGISNMPLSWYRPSHKQRQPTRRARMLKHNCPAYVPPCQTRENHEMENKTARNKLDNHMHAATASMHASAQQLPSTNRAVWDLVCKQQPLPSLSAPTPAQLTCAQLSAVRPGNGGGPSLSTLTSSHQPPPSCPARPGHQACQEVRGRGWGSAGHYGACQVRFKGLWVF